MRHRKKSEKFSRSRAQRKALVKSLLRAIIIEERIVTTESKAKALRKWIDKAIGWGKHDTLHHRRLVYRLLNDHNLVKRVFENISPRFADISGGYTRIIDLGNRKGDGAKTSLIELTKIEKKKRKEKKIEKTEEKITKEEKKKEGIAPRIEKPKKNFFSQIKRVFKKERDSL